MSQDPAPAAEIIGLGTLSTFPLEIRERIYAQVLNLNISITPFSKPPFSTRPHPHNCTCGHLPSPKPHPSKPSPPILSLLLVSKAINTEARPILYQCNEWKIEIEDDEIGSELVQRPNKSIMNLPGWKLQFSHSSHGRRAVFTWEQTGALDKGDMWAELRYVHLSVGGGRGEPGSGILEYDILPWKRQTKHGPERPSFVPLLRRVEQVVEVLDHCRHLHLLRISLRGIEKTPGSMEMVIAPLRRLRGVKRSDVVVVGMQDDFWIDWNLKGSYRRYLNTILGMPRGTTAPIYVGDEKEPDQNENEIFDMIGARWKGGREFAYSGDEGDSDEEEFDDFEAEMEEFDEFMEYMGLNPPMMGMFGPEDPWVSDEDEDKDEDEDEDYYSDDYDEDEDEDYDSEEEETDDEMPELVSLEHHGDESEKTSDIESDDEMPILIPLHSNLASNPQLPATSQAPARNTTTLVPELLNPQHTSARNVALEDEEEPDPYSLAALHFLTHVRRDEHGDVI